MPDPLRYLQAMGVAAIVSASIALMMAALRRPLSDAWRNSVSVLAIGIGLTLGCHWLAFRWQWPPANGLNRLLMLVLPAIGTLELVAGCSAKFPRFARLAPFCLAIAIPRILLDGSVYLTPAGLPVPEQPLAVIYLASGFPLAGSWWLLTRLSQRASGVAISLTIPLSLALATLCAGLSVMLAGYLKGGAAAFPVGGTLLGAVVAAWLLALRFDNQTAVIPTVVVPPAVISAGLVGLFGLLFVGCAFGRLPPGRAAVILLAPLACWATEWRLIRDRNPWIVALLRLILVSIPLLVALILAKREFDRTMAPLLGAPQVSRRSMSYRTDHAITQPQVPQDFSR
ncbi:MAG: hypothetical protein NT069_02580 [Planctomycetota bacterium]|nr:hypothetical protein [Planctomycetota bacterium]